VDVGGLLEEILASAALAGEGAPRYLFRCDEPLSLPWDRAALSEILVGMLTLARRCAGDEGVVSAQVDPLPAEEGRPTGVLVRIDFPLGPLTDGDLPGILEGSFEGAAEVAEDVAAARGAAEVLHRQGGAAELLPHKPGRLRLEVRLPSPSSPAGSEGGPSGDPERGSPEDPFA